MIHVQDYIGGFLLKNKYCTFPSLGTLELRKASASYSDDSLSAPEYKIEFNPVGIIDDAFPTYIADHENVSIAKASNEIRNFSQKVKGDLQKRGRFDVDLVGSFILKDGAVTFKQSDDMNLGFEPVRTETFAEPVQESNGTVDSNTPAEKASASFKNLEYTHADSAVSKPKNGTLIKYLFGLLGLVAIAALAYFAYNYYQNNKSIETEDTSNASDAIISNEEYATGESDDTTFVENEVQNPNSASQEGATTEAATENSSITAAPAGSYNIAVQQFADKNIAESKSKKLNSYGNVTQVKTIDGKHWLVVTASSSSNDVTALKDSLRRFFNPSGAPFVVK